MKNKRHDNSDLPDEVRQQMGLKQGDRVVCWTTGVERGLAKDFCCTEPSIGLLCLPCFWPHMIVLAPVWCCIAKAKDINIKHTYWVYTENGNLFHVETPHTTIVCCARGRHNSTAGAIRPIMLTPYMQLEPAKNVLPCACCYTPPDDLMAYANRMVDSKAGRRVMMQGFGLEDLPGFDKKIRSHAKGLKEQGIVTPSVMALTTDLNDAMANPAMMMGMGMGMGGMGGMAMAQQQQMMMMQNMQMQGAMNMQNMQMQGGMNMQNMQDMQNMQNMQMQAGMNPGMNAGMMNAGAYGGGMQR